MGLRISTNEFEVIAIHNRASEIYKMENFLYSKYSIFHFLILKIYEQASFFKKSPLLSNAE